MNCMYPYELANAINLISHELYVPLQTILPLNRIEQKHHGYIKQKYANNHSSGDLEDELRHEH